MIKKTRYGSLHSPKQLITLYQAIRAIEQDHELSESDQQKSKFMACSTIAQISDEREATRLLRNIRTPEGFNNELFKLTNLELAQEAIRRGDKTFNSLTPCSTPGCGNTVRYVSNRGCILCQDTQPSIKQERGEKATSIYQEHASTCSKKELVDLLTKNLAVGKSTAYSLIEKLEEGKPLYKKTPEPCYDVQEPEALADTIISRVNAGLRLFDLNSETASQNKDHW